MCFRAKLYHVGFSAKGQETEPDPKGSDQGLAGLVDDIEAIQEPLVGVGAVIQNPIADVRRYSLITPLSDPDGDPIGLLEGTA